MAPGGRLNLKMPMRAESLSALEQTWANAFEEALALWSRFTKLRNPVWCASREDCKREGLSDAFAMIRLTDQTICIDLPQIAEKRLEPFAVPILAHEIGHHVYCPATLLDQGRMLARMRYALPTVEAAAPLVANLYADLLINDRLHRACGQDMAAIYRVLQQENSKEPASRLWLLYMRIYEVLWSLPSGDLADAAMLDDTLRGDAILGARLVRSYARDFLKGAGRFATLCLPYLTDLEEIEKLMRGWHDTRATGMGAGEPPAGLAEYDPDEAAGAIHPALDPELSGLDDAEPALEPIASAGNGGHPGTQYREPFQYGEILKSLGLALSDHDIAVRYYRERALPNLIWFPERDLPQVTEPIPEGLELWSMGDPLEDLSLWDSMLMSPVVIPGVTTWKRVWGDSPGQEKARRPLDLDLYIDSSGSMPDPQYATSFLALAGAILALSALRAGAKVQATLWSGPRQFQSTPGFVSDPVAVLRIITGYLGGSTAFPIHVLRDTYPQDRPADRPAHIAIISDDGVDTMYSKDERNNDGYAIAEAALARARGGGTLLLNIWGEVEQHPALLRAREQGWDIHPVSNWEQMTAAAKAISRARYGRS